MKTLYLPPRDVVYLLHFSDPYKGCRHYLGWTNHYSRRMKQHKTGQGAGLTRAAVECGITLTIARLWWGYNWQDERRLHRYGGNPTLCPICNPKAYNHGDRGRKRGRLADTDIPF